MIHAHTELVSSHHPAASGEAISSVRTENAMNVSSSFQHPFHTFLCLLNPGEGNGNPLQYSCLENPMDRGAW